MKRENYHRFFSLHFFKVFFLFFSFYLCVNEFQQYHLNKESFLQAIMFFPPFQFNLLSSTISIKTFDYQKELIRTHGSHFQLKKVAK